MREDEKVRLFLRCCADGMVAALFLAWIFVGFPALMLWVLSW